MTFTIPYNTALSKNRAKTLLGRGSKKFIGLNSTYRKLISDHISNLRSPKSYQEDTKLYVTIRVFRPDFRSDPVNFVDAVCDILKKVINVDDRYYSVWCDWELDKENPRIEIFINENSLPTI